MYVMPTYYQGRECDLRVKAQRLLVLDVQTGCTVTALILRQRPAPFGPILNDGDIRPLSGRMTKSLQIVPYT